MSWHSKSFARQLLILFVAATSMLAASAEAQAFCGFYVSGAGGNLYNNATQVVMMREDTTTVLSMRNNYQGPPKDFAMVIPVPQVLEKANVKVLDDELFDKVDTLAAPRLVEYWEQARCAGPGWDTLKGTRGPENLLARLDSAEMSRAPTVVAKFEVGEYDVVILDARESNGLEKWLLDNKYNIPKGASKAMAQYIAQGMYFFVAKVNADKVTFDSKGNALLSPLRFHYNSEEFSLPVRLGLLNAKGPQDLIVHVLSREGRYHAANVLNVLIPTNIVVPKKTKTNFGAFYEQLFQYTLKQKPGAIVTEYAWVSSKCDPCPGPTLDANDLLTLGADAILGLGRIKTPNVRVTDVRTAQPAATSELTRVRRVLARYNREIAKCYAPLLEQRSPERGEVLFEVSYDTKGKPKDVKVLGKTIENQPMEACLIKKLDSFRFTDVLPEVLTFQFKVYFDYTEYTSSSVPPNGWTLTRLHARYTEKTMTEDLIFEKAPAIKGGRGIPDIDSGALDEATSRSGTNMFQGRYIVLHRSKKKLTCDKGKPYRYWGGPTGKTGEAKTSGAPGMSASSKKTKYSLSKDVQTQVRAQIKAQEDIE